MITLLLPTSLLGDAITRKCVSVHEVATVTTTIPWQGRYDQETELKQAFFQYSESGDILNCSPCRLYAVPCRGHMRLWRMRHYMINSARP